MIPCLAERKLPCVGGAPKKAWKASSGRCAPKPKLVRGAWAPNRQMEMAFAQAGLPPPSVQPPSGNNNQNGGGGFSPEVLPNAAQGVLPQTPGIGTPLQAGPLVEPGRPRPGAQNGNTFNRDVL